MLNNLNFRKYQSNCTSNVSSSITLPDFFCYSSNSEFEMLFHCLLFVGGLLMTKQCTIRTTYISIRTSTIVINTQEMV